MVTDDKKIFTPGTTPQLTYNKRESEKLEEKVRQYLQVGGTIIVVSGPSKIGKTVLIKKVIDKNKRIIIEGGDVRSVEELIQSIIRKLSKIPDELKRIETTDANIETSAEASAGVNFWEWARAQISAKAAGSKNIKKELVFEYDPFERVTQYIIDNDYTLIIDDFHYIKGNVQKEIIRKLKSPLSEGMKIIFALIPSRTEVVIQKEPDMAFRTKVLNVPRWSDEELRYIPDRGFSALNTVVDSRIIDTFVNNSFSNPSLMQAFCSSAEYQYKLNENREETKKVIFNEDEVNDILSDRAEFTTEIKQLENGKFKRGKDRKQYNLKISNGEFIVLDLYKIVMRALSNLSSSDKLSVERIANYIDSLSIEQCDQKTTKIRKSDIVQILKRLTDIASEINPSDPVIEYREAEKTVYMYDSFFSFNLKFHYKNKP